MTEELEKAVPDTPQVTATIEHEPVATPAYESKAADSLQSPAPSTGSIWAALALLAIIVIAGGLFLWNAGQSSDGQFAALSAKLDAIDSRVAKLEARPVPAPVNLGPVQQSVSALESRIAALENKPPPTAVLNESGRDEIAKISGRMDTVTARQNELGTTEQADVAKLGQQITALEGRVAAGVKASSEVTALAAQQSRTAMLQAASAALAAGKPLGVIPGAPPALARLANTPPPTEASLRLSFDDAAAAARRAGQPPPESMSFVDRMLQRAQSSVTVRSGSQVLVGDTLSETLEMARTLLDAGDLAGAVAALGGLTGPAAAAMAPWRAEAQSLLDARAALITAAHG